MQLLNFAIIKLTFCLILGIIIGYFFDISVLVALILSSVFIVVLGVTYLVAKKKITKSIWFGLFAFLTMVSVGILTTNLHNQKQFSNHYTHQISTGTEATNTITFRIREVLKPNRYYNKYVVNILKVNDKSTFGKCLLNIEKDSLITLLNVDATFIGKTEFQEIYEPLNPFQFNYKNYLEKKYIYHQLVLKEREILRANSNSPTLLGVADAVRNHINKKLQLFHFKPDELAIINALLLGQRQDISEEVYTSYANAGVIHILAVSGLHVGIILLILSYVLKPLDMFKYGKLIRTILLVSLLWSFALIAGLSASITRAVTMFSIVAVAINLKRPTNIYNTLAISMFVILLFKPLFLFDVGFQLSYLAVFAIVSIAPYLYKLWKPKNKILDIYWHTLTITISAQFGILPISLFYFHQFPGLFFVSNLLIVPLLGILLSFGILLILLAILNLLPQFLANVYGFIINWMNILVDWVSQQESFLFNDIPFNVWYVLASYILIITFFRLVFNRNFSNLKYFLIGLLCVQCVFIYTHFRKPSNEFVVFHKSRHSLVAHTNNDKTLIGHDLDSVSKFINSSIKDYSVGNFIKHIKEDTLRPIYQLNDKILLVVDSLSVYKVKSFKPEYVLLRQSPKVNLNRLIDSIKPKQIIADGSNYKSYITRWELICKKRKLPFHQTGKNGAFTIQY
ncbi:ComEC/Rec2 family competence protein [Flavisericum labens]|uniref:ComEC/Rec2 family competence protein n=1 Tax=Flavisericum labens TaxID=3377112 RepID=UPI00387B8934